MSPKVFAAFEALLKNYYSEKPCLSALEIGATEYTLLSSGVFDSSRKVAMNLAHEGSGGRLSDCEIVEGNSNNTEFSDGEFDCVMSCSVLEHDKYFWKSIEEIRRILKPGGIWVVGLPIYMALPTDYKHSTLTYARHGYDYNADYYRFSEQAIHEVVMDGFEVFDEVLVRRYPNPYLVCAGVKR